MRSEVATAPKWRTVVFWVLSVALVVLLLGERPFMLGWLVTTWGGASGELATHEVHMLAQSALLWAMIAAVVSNAVRPERRVGSAWQVGLVVVPWALAAIALGDLEPELVPIFAIAVILAVLAFLVHPSELRARLQPVATPHPAMVVLLLVAAVPLIRYGTGQFAIQLETGPGDAHYEFGHWVAMGSFACVTLLLAAVAVLRVAGWRLNAWSAGLLGIVLGLASLVVPAPSALPSPWPWLAILWGAAFVATGEVVARRTPTGKVARAPQVS